MKKFFLIPLTAILLCSCGGLTNITTPNSVALNQGNFRFVKTVTAEVPSVYVFCIGGLSSRATADVVEKLKTSAQLQQNQALADIRIKTTTKLWVFGIVITKKLTATASVVEFINTGRKTNNAIGFEEDTTDIYKGDTTETKYSTTDIEPAVKQDIEPAVKQKDVRETLYKRVQEINTLLKAGTVEDLESLAKEFNDIEKWYGNNGYYTWDENKNMRAVKKLLRSKQTN